MSKKFANASAKQRQMTFAELNSYLAVTFRSMRYSGRKIIQVSNKNIPSPVAGGISSEFRVYTHVGVQNDFMNSVLLIYTL